jgi:hypothetical protein
MPMDPYEWNESVLSTRSLSYLSQVDGFGSRQSSNAPTFRPPTRRSTLDSMDEGLELYVPDHRAHASHQLEDINELPALPTSVARSLLFTLPREIRDRVYSYCLAVPAGESIEWPSKQSVCRYNIAPQLLRTCKLVSAEALPVLYDNNTMSFLHPSDANMFVRAMASPSARHKITRLHLVVKAQDDKTWTPYLLSTEKSRSLKEDFPVLRELTIRYASNKWQHGLPIEANLRHWNDDSKLTGIMKGLTAIYYPHLKKGKGKSKDIPLELEDLPHATEELPDAEPSPLPGMTFKQRLLEHSKTVRLLAPFQAPPTIKVVVACRIQSAAFAALISSAPLPQPHIAPLPPAAHLFGAGNNAAVPPPPPPPPHMPGLPLPGVAALLDGILPGSDLADSHDAVEDGEEFRGFTHKDFIGRKTIVARGGKESGKEIDVQVSRTEFARSGKVLLALEVFAAESR